LAGAGTVMQFVLRRLERSLESGRILAYLIGAITFPTFLSGVVIRIADPESFPSLGVALWWAATTVTTIGYGDVVPEQPLGRAVATVLMIGAFGSLSLLTGIIASLFVARRAKPAENQALMMMHRVDDRLERLEQRLERRLDELGG
jgi:voltage-gated potassium channel